VHGERIFVTDLADSIHVLKFRPKMQTFYEFADDILPRWISSALVLDHRTVVAGDKFENVFVCRLPAQVDDEADDELATYKFKWETGYLNGAAHKVLNITTEIFLLLYISIKNNC
jgi:splicing factor 3B subunit 3